MTSVAILVDLVALLFLRIVTVNESQGLNSLPYISIMLLLFVFT